MRSAENLFYGSIREALRPMSLVSKFFVNTGKELIYKHLTDPKGRLRKKVVKDLLRVLLN